MHFYLKILSFIFILSCFLPVGKAQDRLSYDSNTLKSICEKIEYRDSTSIVNLSLPNYPSIIPISVERNRVNTITNIGIDIFGDAIKCDSDKILFEFVERYLLELLLEPDSRSVKSRNEIDDVEIEGNLRDIPLIVGQSSDGMSLEVVCSDKSYNIAWGGESNKFSISFPANYSLIAGKSKIELEDGFYDEFRAYIDNHTHTPEIGVNAKKLSKISDNIYQYDQGYYMEQSMRNVQYFERKGNGYCHICNPGQPYESLVNLASINTPSPRVILDVEQHKYGSINNGFYCVLSDLVAFCLKQGCTPYVSVDQDDSIFYVVTIFMVNYDYMYNHTIQLAIEKEYFLDETVVATCSINTYIPTHNLSVLYDEANQVNSNKKIKL